MHADPVVLLPQAGQSGAEPDADSRHVLAAVIEQQPNPGLSESQIAPPSQVQGNVTHSQGMKQAAKVSKEANWPLKSIIWPPHSDKRVLIVMQARNGPCSLIALCNVLILRNEVVIHPPDRPSVSYEYLASLIADYIVSRMGDSPIEGLAEALQKLPDLQEGMDINSTWGSYSSFKQLGDGGELKVFELCGVPLVHGWLADPSSPEYGSLMRVGDYDSALNLIVAADDATRGQLVQAEHSLPLSPAAPAELAANQDLSDIQKLQVSDAIAIRHFLDSNSSQLTYFGLFTLSSSLTPGLYSFFRNSHLSVLYKPDTNDEPLYTLVTDSAFTHEPDVVWETLEDVDGSASSFLNSSFMQSSTAGGDYSGATAEDALTEMERAMRAVEIHGDMELAHQLQAEEEAAAREELRRHQARKASRAATQASGGNPTRSRDGHSDGAGGTVSQERQPEQSLKSKKSKDRDCVIM